MPLFKVDIVATVVVEAQDETKVYSLAEDSANWIDDDVTILQPIGGSAVELDEDGVPLD